MQKIKSLLIVFITLTALFSCNTEYENPIDDTRIIGTWHQKNYIENNITIAESDSIVYHFLEDGRMIIKYYADWTASQPDQNYEFDLQNGVLRYWNLNDNVSEIHDVTFAGNSELKIKKYSSYFLQLFKVF